MTAIALVTNRRRLSRLRRERTSSSSPTTPPAAAPMPADLAAWAGQVLDLLLGPEGLDGDHGGSDNPSATATTSRLSACATS